LFLTILFFVFLTGMLLLYLLIGGKKTYESINA
jgi:hypothetical protein